MTVACTVIIAVCALLLPTIIHGAVKCDKANACFPWASPPCARGNSMNLRFFMEAAPEYDWSSFTPGTNFTNRSITYAFCPRVDELQAFNLSRAPEFSAVSPTDNTTFIKDMTDTYVSVYGFGESNNKLVPTNMSASSVMIARNGSDVCTNVENPILLVEFLVFQIAMSGGTLSYIGAEAPFGNSSGVSVQPQGTGFIPTCNAGLCNLDASMKCIGPEGRQNCATCYTDPISIANKTVQVWVSYYGTDSQGRRMMSGSNNPLNFRQYAGTGVYNTLNSALTNIQNGQVLDPTLNNV